VGEKRSYREIH